MVKIPDFLEDGPIEPATEERRRTRLCSKRVLELIQRISCFIRGGYPRRSQQIKGRVHVECADDGIKEINHVLVLLVAGPVAGHVERRGASRMLGKLVRPKRLIWGTLVDPILAHVV